MKSINREKKQYFDYLIDLFIYRYLSSQNNAQWTSYKQYFLLTVTIKDSNIMTDRKNIFGHPVRSDGRTYDNIKIIETGWGDSYATVCLLFLSFLLLLSILLLLSLLLFLSFFLIIITDFLSKLFHGGLSLTVAASHPLRTT